MIFQVLVTVVRWKPEGREWASLVIPQERPRLNVLTAFNIAKPIHTHYTWAFRGHTQVMSEPWTSFLITFVDNMSRPDLAAHSPSIPITAQLCKAACRGFMSGELVLLCHHQEPAQLSALVVSRQRGLRSP